MTESNQMHTAENNNSGGVQMEPPTPPEQQYSLKWNDFQTSILSSFRHLRDEEDFVDVTLACDRRSFTAHKVVLSACSPYFRKLLKANPCEHPIIILRDFRSEDVESLLRFMYNGEVNIGHQQLTDFLRTAQLLQVRGLVDVGGPTTRPAILQNLTAAVQALPTSTSLPWEFPDDRSNQPSPTPPAQKRVKSADLYRAQHGISPDRFRERDLTPTSHLPSSQRQTSRDRERERDRDSRDNRERERDRSLELRDSLLGQALEGGPTLIVPSQKNPDLVSLHAQSAGEDSISSDGDASDRDDGMDGAMDGMNGSLDHPRTSSFPGSFLGLPGIPGLLPGPSGIHGDNFVSRRSLEMRVRATDPRPCPKCGKIYRSAHTLRTHLEDKHTVCPGYRCVLCGTVAKSRNSLHSHMSRQHRGISTKDLPVLPMPSPFDPELASRLLAKAGVKISAAELRARASPTSGTRRSDIKLELRQPGDDTMSTLGDMDNDPEDLTMGGGGNNNNGNSTRYHDAFVNHPNTTITRVRHGGALTPKSMDSMTKDSHGNPLNSTAATGSAILDTYLQFITENTFGMGMTQEQAAAALHAAKMAQLGAMGHDLDKLPPGLLPPHLDLTKLNRNDIGVRDVREGRDNREHQLRDHDRNDKMQSSTGIKIESTNSKNQSTTLEIRRGDSTEPMDQGHDNMDLRGRHDSDRDHHNDGGNSSGDEANYTDEDGACN